MNRNDTNIFADIYTKKKIKTILLIFYCYIHIYTDEHSGFVEVVKFDEKLINEYYTNKLKLYTYVHLFKMLTIEITCKIVLKYWELAPI